VQPPDLIATVPASSAALVASATAAGLDAPVPSCPGWTAETLVRHTGNVLRYVGKVVEAGGPVNAQALPKAPFGPLVVQWFEEMASGTAAALSARDSGDELWNWAGQPPVVAFWQRRMAHEVAMHAADAALAAGEPPRIEAQLAADGIDELLSVLLPVKVAAGRADLSGVGSVHVHCTDTEGEWLVQPSAGGVEVTREHAKGDAALRGPAGDLLLRLCNRGTGGEVVGEPSVVATLTERFTF